MNPIGHALRLLDTQQALLGALLAVAVVAAACMIAFIRLIGGRVRWMGALLILAAGLSAGTGIVEASYSSWHRHRCVLHHSDIDECSVRGGWLSDERH